MSQTLDEWIERNGMQDLYKEFQVHAECGHQQSIPRLCFISLRQHLESRVDADR